MLPDTDSCSALDRETVRWYLEDYAKYDPFESQRATEARALIQRYRKSFSVLKLSELISVRGPEVYH